MSLNPKEKKQVRISPTVHREMYRIKAETGKDLDDLVAEAWELYKYQLSGDSTNQSKTNTPPLENASDLKENQELILSDRPAGKRTS